MATFLATCAVVRGLRRVRLGAIGARPNAFNTTRFSEKLLEASGISVNTIDLSEIFGNAGALIDTDPRVRQRVDPDSGLCGLLLCSARKSAKDGEVRRDRR